jgi:uncharacterized protein YlxP (DUF503 family)
MSIPWAKSLKEKRMCVKSLIERLRHKFNISIAEIGLNDAHTQSEIGFALVSNSKSLAEEMGQNILNFAEEVTEAEIYDIDIEIL